MTIKKTKRENPNSYFEKTKHNELARSLILIMPLTIEKIYLYETVLTTLMCSFYPKGVFNGLQNSTFLNYPLYNGD
jgi:hypothetical protein